MEQIFNQLTKLIKTNKKIIIMTHKNPDFDGIGAAIGLQQIINTFNIESFVLVNKENNESLLKSYKLLEENKLYFKTITSKESLKLTDFLLIILDTHKKSMVEEPLLLNITDNYIVIDHHIKSKNCIVSNKLSYINSNLSSTVEFISCYIKYLNKTVDPLVATIMLVGLEIDTNNFRLKTTQQTYEAASFLSSLGADNVLKQELLQENKSDYLSRQNIIKNSFLINDSMMLAIADDKIYEPKDLAIIAIELLNFKNVQASFVIGKLKNDYVGISSRSLGNFDVEKIMIDLGGGGHKYEAATQIKNNDIFEVKNMLINAINKSNNIEK